MKPSHLIPATDIYNEILSELKQLTDRRGIIISPLNKLAKKLGYSNKTVMEMLIIYRNPKFTLLTSNNVVAIRMSR